jgi:hypothetical protein
MTLPTSQYPEGIHKYDYVPNFAARGLHYDIQKVNIDGHTFCVCNRFASRLKDVDDVSSTSPYMPRVF